MLDICAKFHDHQSNNNKVMMGALMPPTMTDGSKKSPCQIGLKLLLIGFATFDEVKDYMTI